jgi:cation transport protein ChaC
MAEEFWVFGYGSLMWNPGFDHVERVKARLEGYQRSFCLASVRYRGTREYPGLVLALEPRAQAACTGVAFRVSRENADDALQYLRERELGTASYFERRLPLTLIGRAQEQVRAICYVMDIDHEQYRGHLDEEERARVIANATGPAGTNREYLFRTLENLTHLDVEEPALRRLADRVVELSRDG